MSSRRERGGYPGAGGSGGPGGGASNPGARGALLLAVAVILGIVLLQKFDSGIDTGGEVATGDSVPEQTSTSRRGVLTTVPQVTTTTLRTRPKAEVRVLVANGAGVRGLGAATSNALKNLGYATLTPTDASRTVDKTAVQYAEGYEAEAREVATSLTLPANVVSPLASPPVAASALGDAKVVVILGVDVPNSATTTTSTTRR